VHSEVWGQIKAKLNFKIESANISSLICTKVLKIIFFTLMDCDLCCKIGLCVIFNSPKAIFANLHLFPIFAKKSYGQKTDSF
jgi:hypothetical protein